MIEHENLQVLARNIKNMDNVMQFTGLLDKNGAQIFEGDILKIAISSAHPANVLVKWLRDGWVGGAANLHPLVSNKIGGSCCKIIGNIHQNPELLNE